MDSNKKLFLIIFFVVILFSLIFSLSLNTTVVDYKIPKDYSTVERVTVVDYKVPKDYSHVVMSEEYFGVVD